MCCDKQWLCKCVIVCRGSRSLVSITDVQFIIVSKHILDVRLDINVYFVIQREREKKEEEKCDFRI